MLDLQSEIKFVQTATLEEFTTFLSRTFLSTEAQVALAKRNQNDLLKEYVSKFKVCDDAQVVLAELRNKEILLLCVAKYKLCIEATKKLIELI